MKLDPKTFLALDGTASALMHSTWEPIAQAAIDTIAPLLEQGRWASAHAAIDDLHMRDLVPTHRARLEELAVSALLFGAHHVTGDLTKTSYMAGEPVPHQVTVALDQLDHSLGSDGTDALRKMLHEFVASVAAGDTGRVSLMKCDDVSNPDCACGGAHLSANMKFDPHLGQQSREDAAYERGHALELDRNGRPYYQAYGYAAYDVPYDATLDEMHAILQNRFYSVPDPRPMAYYEPRFQMMTGDGHRVGRELLRAMIPDKANPLAGYSHGLREAATTGRIDGDAMPSHYTPTLHDLRYNAADTTDDSVLRRQDGGNLYTGVSEGDGFADAYADDVIRHSPIDYMREDAASRHGYMQLYKADRQQYADALYEATMNGGKGLIDIAATLTTSRVISLGFLSQAHASGHDTYQVDEVLDDKTCPVCRFMNGKRFKVQNELGKTLQALGTSDPADLKSIAPWPSQSRDGLAMLYGMDESELQVNGYGSPPYHPNCRGMLSLVEEDQVAQTAQAQRQVDVGQDPEDEAAQAVSDASDALSDLAALYAAGTDAEIAPDITALGAARDIDVSVIVDPALKRSVSLIEDQTVQEEIIDAYETGDLDLLKQLLDDAGIKYTEDQLEIPG